MLYPQLPAIVLHPPKTAGQALQKALGMSPVVHTDAFGVKRHDALGDILAKKPDAAGWPKYMTVRHPQERLVSAYFYWTVNMRRHRLESRLIQRLVRFLNFEDWILHEDWDELLSLPIGRGVRHSALRPQVHYGKVNGVFDTSIRLIRHEVFKSDVQHFFKVTPDERVNESLGKRRVIWSERMTEIVVNVFSEDFTQLGYSGYPARCVYG